MKNYPSKVSYTNAKKKRNLWLFDAGLHTQHMKMKDDESDNQFVQRFLISYFNGCRSRGGKKYRDYLLMHEPENNYISILGIK